MQDGRRTQRSQRWRRRLRATGLLVVVALVLVLPSTNTSSLSTTTFRPQHGYVDDLRVAPVRAGGWEATWAAAPNAAEYRVTIDGRQLLATADTRAFVPDDVHRPERRPGPVIEVQALTAEPVVRPDLVTRALGEPSTALGCPPYVFVGVRGSGQNTEDEGYGQGLGDRGWTVANHVRRRLAVGTSTVASIGLTYPANRVDTVDGVLTYPQSNRAGRAALRGSLAQWREECPDSRYVLFGYSQGADVIATEWPGLPDDVKAQVAWVTLFGDPHYNPADRSAQDPAATASGPLGAREPLDDPVVHSWCAPMDVVCQGTAANLVALRDRVHGSRYDAWQEVEAGRIAKRLAGELSVGPGAALAW